ncbi:cupin domain-containing protein [Celeribacter sp.]|uniref:cupin domain-containing protein n=1 Tax=Celeribacter sp. TaxID=1890673 RepID=UPI003A8E906E
MPKHTPDTVRCETSDGSDTPCGPYRARLFSDSGGLTQFGAFEETLPPGSSSSIKHWHAIEDEMIYMVAGTVTIEEGTDSYRLSAGEAATFKAGVPKAHRVINTSDAPATYLVIGTRSAGDTVTYPEHDRVLRFTREAGEAPLNNREYTTLDGRPATSPYTVED